MGKGLVRSHDVIFSLDVAPLGHDVYLPGDSVSIAYRVYLQTALRLKDLWEHRGETSPRFVVTTVLPGRGGRIDVRQPIEEQVYMTGTLVEMQFPVLTRHLSETHMSFMCIVRVLERVRIHRFLNNDFPLKAEVTIVPDDPTLSSVNGSDKFVSRYIERASALLGLVDFFLEHADSENPLESETLSDARQRLDEALRIRNVKMAEEAIFHYRTEFMLIGAGMSMTIRAYGVLPSLFPAGMRATRVVSQLQKILECQDPLERLCLALAFLGDEKKRREAVAISSDEEEPESGDQGGVPTFPSSPASAQEEERITASSNPKELYKRYRKIKQHIPHSICNVIEQAFQSIRAQDHMAGKWIEYLRFVLWLSWGVYKGKADVDIKEVGAVLEKSHYGLPEVKDRIAEYVAVLKRKKALSSGNGGKPLLFLGPPGVGKTSLGRGIAEAIGRDFVSIALGGVHDESEIRGYGFTYIGSKAGRVMDGFRNSASMNPVVMLDQIDLIGRHSAQGDPAGALIELLDPEQNFRFQDHYIGGEFDVSHALYIATANTLEGVAPALIDRFEIIEFPGYTKREKEEIAKRHLIPNLLKKNGLVDNGVTVTFPDDVIRQIISEYVHEAGLRGLEKLVDKLLRKVAVRIERGEFGSAVLISNDFLREALGPPRYKQRRAEEPKVGVVYGLAVSSQGGFILPVEAVPTPGLAKPSSTGYLGTVMYESVKLALSLLKTKILKNSSPKEVFCEERNGTKALMLPHVHFPEGAIPKDGPSAGLAAFLALVSAYLQALPAPRVAMTGEITLSGKVLAVGGIREKCIGAENGGMGMLILPKANEPDVALVPQEVRDKIKFRFVEHVCEAIPILFPDLKIECDPTK